MSLLEKPSKLVAYGVMATFLTATNVAFAQQTQGWPSADNPNPPATAQTPNQPASNPNPYDQNQQQQPADNGQNNYPQAQQGPYGPPPVANPQPPGPYAQPPQYPYPAQQGPYGQQPGPYTQQSPYGAYPTQPGPYGPNPYAAYPAPRPIPAELTVTAGTPLAVRVNQELKADRDHPGTMFTATLVQPLIVNGVVAAQPGATVTGQVVDTQDSRGVKALGKYGLVLTNLTLVDGQQLPIHAPITTVREHVPNAGQDVGTMAVTTGIGAAIGGAIGWGTGAAIGAGVGALAGAAVLVNEHAHNNIKPEELMTFNLQSPVEISTANAPQAFHYVMPGEFAPQLRTRYAYAPAAAPYPYYYYGPYLYPSFGVVYYGGHYYRRYWR